MTTSQNNQILRALRQGRKITPLDALYDFGCMRLSSRIYDIKRMGYTVHTELVQLSNGKKVACYSIPRESILVSFDAVKARLKQLNSSNE